MVSFLVNKAALINLVLSNDLVCDAGLHLESRRMQTSRHATWLFWLFVHVYFLIGSTVATSRTQVHSDGNTYPYVALDISSASHPFYTGQSRQAKAEGRVARFNQRYGRRTGVTGDAGKGEQ